MNKEEQSRRGEDVIAGRNAVTEALRSGRPIDSLYVARGAHTGSIGALIAKAKKQGIPVKEADAKKLDYLCGNAVHQGVVALAAAHTYASLDDLFALAQERGEPPFFIVADELEDPHNLGAIIRSADAAGAHGVIIPRRGGAGLTAAVMKASAGAAQHLPVARVANLASTVQELQKKNIWVYAADMDGEDWCTVDYAGGVALVIGSEGSGVSRLLRERSDRIVSLPMYGRVNSLNASVAAGILLYEVARQRRGIKAR